MITANNPWPSDKLILIALLMLTGACGRSGETTDHTGVDGVERANADIRAAETATQVPATINRSAGELTGKAGRDPRDTSIPTKAVAKAVSEPAAAVVETPSPAEPIAPIVAPTPAEAVPALAR